MECKICGNGAKNSSYSVKEMMFGYRDEFQYMLCSSCGCLQIEEVPHNLAHYYPDTYYSYQKVSEDKPTLRSVLIGMRDRYALFNRGLLGKWLYSKYPNDLFKLLSDCGVHMQSRILDVGCGAGDLLFRLKKQGLEHVLGIDPYNVADVCYPNGLRILKRDIHGIDGEWDMVMFHHSFEHMSDQLETLRKVCSLLSPEGICILRMPVVSSYAWRQYGVNWADLDAPRHLFLHSLKSLQILAGQARLDVFKTIFDSTAFQFWGSEQYQRNIPLMDERSYAKNPGGGVFSRAEIEAFEKKAKELNVEQQGDQAVFFLRKASA